MAPVQRQLLWLSVSGAGLILAFACAGLYFGERKIVNPVRVLREAAQGIAARAHLSEAETLDGQAVLPQPGLQDALSRVNAATALDSGDEIADLSHDFMLMAKRVLRYHEQLEAELATKTEEIQKDLVIAREFQEALLPNRYPTVPAPANADPIALDFYHVYKPASSVSGDLVYIIQLSDHEAGVFVADVMGHGARSALISAILRALMQNASRETRDPAAILEQVNRQFLEILPKAADLIYATALAAVFDTQAGQVHMASAGHPSPLLARQASGNIEPILDVRHNNPALGLKENAHYRGFTRTLAPGDIYLLYTDGVVEAPNITGEEFGRDRLRAVMASALGTGGRAMADAVIGALHQFMDVVVSPDDICLVTIGIRERHRAGA